MKAIILATETGEGLWPVPAGGSCLGAPLPGQSLLEWYARALGDAGATGLITAAWEGAAVPAQNILPMSVYRFPAGTGETQALLSCAEGLEEDFLILSGGLLWSGSLRPALEAHAGGGSLLTRVEFRSPPETDWEPRRGRVVPFPSTGPDSLGLAVCSPALLPFLAGTADWAGLLARLRRNRALGSAEILGHCRRIGSPAALLDAAEWLLRAKCLPEAGEPLRPGIWSASPLPEDVELVPPCVIGAGVRLGRGSLIGPHAVLEDGVWVEDHALIQRSILQRDVRVGSHATIYGAVVCRRAELGSRTVLNEGAAVGPDARIGDGAALMEGVGIGAGERIPPSTRLTASLCPPRTTPAWTVERLLALGRKLGRCGQVGAGGAGFQGLLLARAFGCGAAAQGAAVVLHDGLLPRQAAWLAGYYRWPVSLFADEDGQIYLFDENGEALSSLPPEGEPGEGSWDLLAGTASAWAAACERGDAPAQAAFRPFVDRELL